MSNGSMWQPFNALAPGNQMVDDVLKRKNKVSMPVLSDDQMMEIQDKVLDAFNNGSVIKIKYFKNGRYYMIEGKISNIDANAHIIEVNGRSKVFFSQILQIL